MRVLALLSGGKDSVRAVDVARQTGWDVVAALMLRPSQDDAWMFHTPNLDVVAGVAECLDVPLVEAPVRHGQEQEVEDLQAALADAKDRFELEGIVSGALASEYQRTRIDRIGQRLGLKSFAPLWHKDPREYLHDLLEDSWDIRFSRTAAEGVPLTWAGQRLVPAKVDAMLAHKARPHVAGEGGEYETLVLGCPAYSRRLVVDAAHVEATASRATWVVDRWHTEAKA